MAGAVTVVPNPPITPPPGNAPPGNHSRAMIAVAKTPRATGAAAVGVAVIAKS